MKTILITGATAGIGLHSAVQLGRQGHHLILVGRVTTKLADAERRVRAAGALQVDSMCCDLASLDQVDELADAVAAKYSRLDVLINNAGGMFPRWTLTQDNIEATFAVNHLAPYLLTERLKALMTDSAPARIVVTASSGHYRANATDFDDLRFEQHYNGFKAYYRSKLANVMYARALARELDGRGVTVNSLHPGAVATGIWNSTPRMARPFVTIARRWAMLTPEEGGGRITFAATDPAMENVTGAYLSRDRPKSPSRIAMDDELWKRLRVISDDLAGVNRPPSDR